jgi:hypothetical protein
MVIEAKNGPEHVNCECGGVNRHQRYHGSRA